MKAGAAVKGVWSIGTSRTHGAGAVAATGTPNVPPMMTIGPQGHTGPLVWRFNPPKPDRYEHQLTGKRQFCVKVTVLDRGRAIPSLATRLHRNSKDFEWREADPKKRMATREPGDRGTYLVSNEGVTWCRGWKRADVQALQAASALANT